MRHLLSILFFVFINTTIQAQDNLGIGTLTPNPNALVDMTANDKGLLIPRLSTAERGAITVGLTETGMLVFDTDDLLFYFWEGATWIPFPQTVISADDQNLTGANLVGTTLQIDIENGLSAIVDLASLQDGIGTDNQTLQPLAFDAATNILTVTLEDGGTQNIDLSDLQDAGGSDDQNLTGATLTGTSLQIDIEDGTSALVDLASLQDGTGTDDQTLTFNSATGDLTIADGNTITLPLAAGGDNWGAQTVVSDASLTGDGTAGNPLSAVNNGTDDQTLLPLAFDAATNILTVTLEDGGTQNIDLSDLQDAGGSDDQNLTGATLTGTSLQIDIEGGTSALVDLAFLQDGVDDADNVIGNEYNNTFTYDPVSGDLTITDGGGPLTVNIPAGIDGTDGIDGAVGAQGPAGIDGIDGIDGAIGAQGPAGIDGTDGIDGAVGAQGPAGIDGTDGIDGAIGAQGPAGIDGTDGIDGAVGAQGPAGIDGTDGIDGAVGAQGPQGDPATDTDDQTIDVLVLDGDTMLQISLEDDDEPTLELDLSPLNENDWHITGNTATDESTNFLGTTDAQDLVIRTNNLENMRINSNGNVGIGTPSNTARLFTETPNTDATTNFGFRNNFEGSDAGIAYAIYNSNNGSTNTSKYGIYNTVNATGIGARYGIYNSVYQNTTSISAAYGFRTFLNSYGSGDHYGIYNDLDIEGATITNFNYGAYRRVDVGVSTYTGTVYGDYTNIDFFAGTRYGEYKNMTTSTTSTGIIYADYNNIEGAGNDEIYGVYADISNTGTGEHYGFYADVPGGTNDYAAFYNQGNVVMNEVGGDYDVRMESDTRPNMFRLDASADLVRIGNDLTGATDNGTVVNGNTVDYVIDLDNGLIQGTAIGIGSVEYLLDNSSETTINNQFSPSEDNSFDLGSATLRWDDVYATNGTIVTSDEREKEQIIDMVYGLDEILKLRPVTYKWKRNNYGSTILSDDEKELKLGLIAQEVQEILPEVVQTHDWVILSEEEPDVYTREPMERLGMSYHEIVPVLVKAIQEQQDEIETLQKQLETILKLLQNKE